MEVYFKNEGQSGTKVIGGLKQYNAGERGRKSQGLLQKIDFSHDS